MRSRRSSNVNSYWDIPRCAAPIYNAAGQSPSLSQNGHFGSNFARREFQLLYPRCHALRFDDDCRSSRRQIGKFGGFDLSLAGNGRRVSQPTTEDSNAGLQGLAAFGDG